MGQCKTEKTMSMSILHVANSLVANKKKNKKTGENWKQNGFMLSKVRVYRSFFYNMIFRYFSIVMLII